MAASATQKENKVKSEKKIEHRTKNGLFLQIPVGIFFAFQICRQLIDISLETSNMTSDYHENSTRNMNDNDDDDNRESSGEEEGEENEEEGTLQSQRAKQALTCRKVTLTTLMNDGVIEPGKGVLAIDYLGQRFEADLLENGKIKWHGSEQEFNTPSAWAMHCKRLVNTNNMKRSGCGWASVKYKGKKLDIWKSIWARKLNPIKSPHHSSVNASPSTLASNSENISSPSAQRFAIKSSTTDSILHAEGIAGISQSTVAIITHQGDKTSVNHNEVTNGTTACTSSSSPSSSSAASSSARIATVNATTTHSSSSSSSSLITSAIPPSSPSLLSSSSSASLSSPPPKSLSALLSSPLPNSKPAKSVSGVAANLMMARHELVTESTNSDVLLSNQSLHSATQINSHSNTALQLLGESQSSPSSSIPHHPPPPHAHPLPSAPPPPPPAPGGGSKRPSPTLLALPAKDWTGQTRTTHTDIVLRDRKRMRYSDLDMRSPDADMNTLIQCESFDKHKKLQPFSLLVSSNALLLMDFHCHLTRSEVAGYLGGHWDPVKQVLTIVQSFPVLCRFADKLQASVVEDEIRRRMRGSKLVLVGWYHSHPYCQPLPSIRDVDCQMAYQLQMRGAGATYHPCVGFIEAPFNKENNILQSFWVMPNLENPSSLNIPMNMAFSVRRDLSLTEDILIDMKLLSEFYSGAPDRVRFKEKWKDDVSFLEKIRGSMASKLPEDQLSSGTFLDYMQQLLRDMK